MPTDETPFEAWWAYYTAVLTREPYPDERLTARQAWAAATERAAGVVAARFVDALPAVCDEAARRPRELFGLEAIAAIRAASPPAAGGAPGARAARDGTAIARGNDPEPDVSPASLPHGGDPPCPRP